MKIYTVDVFLQVHCFKVYTDMSQVRCELFNTLTVSKTERQRAKRVQIEHNKPENQPLHIAFCYVKIKLYP